MATTTSRGADTPRDGAAALRALRGIVPRGYAGIATRMRVSRQTVSAWANRRASPSVKHIRRMRKRLGVDERLWVGKEQAKGGMNN